MSRAVAIGLDLGGTHVRLGAFDPGGHLLARREASIAGLGPEAGLPMIERLIHELAASLDSPTILGIGIGSTGPLDTIRGLINNPYTLAGWSNVPIVDHLSRAFNIPVRLENDADAAALGEYWQGAGQEASRLYAVTVGTGVGTSLILEGEIYRGLDGSHPEGGHQLIDPQGPECYCGHRGCWESLISGPAIASRARETPGNEHLLAMADGDPERLDARLVAEAARLGDPTALSIMGKAAHNFGLGIVNVISLFVPDVLVLSGGVMKSATLFLPALEKILQTPNPMVPFGSVRILPARLGYYAALYGGAYMIIHESQ